MLQASLTECQREQLRYRIYALRDLDHRWWLSFAAQIERRRLQHERATETLRNGSLERWFLKDTRLPPRSARMDSQNDITF